ncbi:MAG: TatD DNase family protein [Phenylobacterium sp.]|jgi:TatD DNase family protein
MTFIDSHCHLDFACFDADREAVISSVTAAIVPAVGADNWSAVLALASNHPNVYPALGIHPCFIPTEQDVTPLIDQLTALITSNRSNIVAIGECGLDFVHANDEAQRQLQLVYFTAQLQLAKQFALPVILHHRKSHDIILRSLRQRQLAQGGVIHAFSGSYQQAMQYIDLGFKLGIGGTITYDRAIKTRQVIARVPLEALVLETDAPDMPIYGRQGERNSPQFIGEIFAVLCLLREESAQVIEQTLLATTKDLFGLTFSPEKNYD